MFTSTIILVPGLGNSGEDHWQTYWQHKYHFNRVEQDNWEHPDCDKWIQKLEDKVRQYHTSEVILTGHSLACATIAKWAAGTTMKIKGALLVAPADTDAPGFPPVTTGFSPMPARPLPFASVVVASTNDEYVTIERAAYFARCWGSRFVNIGAAGHINAAAGYHQWTEGIELLKKLETNL